MFIVRHFGGPKLNALTGLRFFAAALIVIEHLQLHGLPKRYLEGFVLDNGVSFFFVLSGFILSYVYPALETREGVRRFLVARFARIWPMHLATLVVLLALEGDAAVLGLANLKSIMFLGLNLALVHAWIPIGDFFFSFNSVSWTISTEFFFYLLFPLLLWNFGRSWWWKLALAFMLVVGLIYFCNVANLPPYAGSTPMTVTTTGLIYVNPLARLFEFVLGMCAALAWRSYGARLRFGLDLGTAIEAAAILLVVYSAFQTPLIGSIGAVRFGPAAGEWLAHGGAICSSVAVLVFVMALGEGHISRVIGSRTGVFLGEISYSMYLIHSIILYGYATHRDWFASWPGEVKLVAYVIVLLGLSFAFWKFVEKPMRVAIVRRFAPVGGSLVRYRGSASET